MVSDYGGRHQATRRAMLPGAEGQPCSRCGQPMHQWQALDLDHTDDRGGYRGFSHARCNRSAGGRIGAQRMRAARRARRERSRVVLTEVVLGVQISEDRRYTSVAAAGRVDADTVLVDLLAYIDGTDAVSAIQDLHVGRTVLAVAIDVHSPGATLARPLAEAGVVVTEMSSSDVVIAHGVFLDELHARRLRHGGQSQLDAAVRFGTQRPLGGAQAWARRGAVVDTSPLDAATFAVWGLLTRPAPFFGARWAAH